MFVKPGTLTLSFESFKLPSPVGSPLTFSLISGENSSKLPPLDFSGSQVLTRHIEAQVKVDAKGEALRIEALAGEKMIGFYETPVAPLVQVRRVFPLTAKLSNGISLTFHITFASKEDLPLENHSEILEKQGIGLQKKPIGSKEISLNSSAVLAKSSANVKISFAAKAEPRPPNLALDSAKPHLNPSTRVLTSQQKFDPFGPSRAEPDPFDIPSPDSKQPDLKLSFITKKTIEAEPIKEIKSSLQRKGSHDITPVREKPEKEEKNDQASRASDRSLKAQKTNMEIEKLLENINSLSDSKDIGGKTEKEEIERQIQKDREDLERLRAKQELEKRKLLEEESTRLKLKEKEELEKLRAKEKEELEKAKAKEDLERKKKQEELDRKNAKEKEELYLAKAKEELEKKILKEQLEDTKKELEKAKSKIESLSSANKDLTDQTNLLRSELETFKEEVAAKEFLPINIVPLETQQELEKTKKDLETLRSSVAETSKQLKGTMVQKQLTDMLMKEAMKEKESAVSALKLAKEELERVKIEKEGEKIRESLSFETNEASLREREQDLEAREAEILKYCTELKEVEIAQHQSEQLVKEKEERLDKASEEVRKKEEIIAAKEERLELKENELGRQEEAIKEKEESLKNLQSVLSDKENDSSIKEKEIRQRQLVLDERESAIRLREEEFSKQVTNLKEEQEAFLASQAESLKVAKVGEKSSSFEKESDLEAREATLREKEAQLESKFKIEKQELEGTLLAKEKEVEQLQKELDKTLASRSQIEDQLLLRDERRISRKSMTDEGALLHFENDNLRKKLKLLESREALHSPKVDQTIQDLQNRIIELENQHFEIEKEHQDELAETEQRVKEQEQASYGHLEAIHLAMVDKITHAMDLIQSLHLRPEDREKIQKALM